MRILIAGGGTGGHLMPALALAEALRALDRDVEPVLVGAVRGVEARLLPSRPFRYHLLPVEPLYRARWWRNARWPLIALRVWRAATRVIGDERPALAVGTGGYAAGPVLLAALRHGVPLALQEQNAYPGLTTRWLARRARQIHLGFPEAVAQLRPGTHTEVYVPGNPIVPPPVPLPEPAAARAALGVPPDRPVVLAIGGSQGARAINHAVAGAVDAGAFAGITLLWSTGPGMWEAYAHYGHPPERVVRPFWDPIAEAYAVADLVVSRAGAMTTAELCAWGLPAVYVPLPLAAAGHQTRNAQALATADAALHLAESRLDPTSLADAVQGLLRAPERRAAMARAARSRGHPKAAETIARRLLALVS